MLPIVAFSGGSCVYNLFDYGMSNLLGVQTLEHGTNALNYVSIRLRGGDPSHGAKSTGSTKGIMKDDTSNYFYLFKDREFREAFNARGFGSNRFKPLMRINPVAPLTRGHCLFSSYNLGYRGLLETDFLLAKIARIYLGIISGLAGFCFVPTLKFRFASVDGFRFEEDTEYKGLAWKTAQKVEAWRIGLMGTLLTGLNTGWFKRAAEDPFRIVKGAAQLACAGAIGSLFAATVISNPTLMVATAAGMLLA